MNNEALVVGVSSFLAASVYLYVGDRLALRRTSAETRVPALQFALFWFGLAASTFLTGIESLIAAFGTVPLGIAVSFLIYDTAVITAALWGLICYLWFLYTGRSGVVPISILYIVEFGLVVYYSSAGNPTGVTVTYGTVQLVLSSSVYLPITIVAVLILIVPEFAAGLAYLRLYFRTHDRTVRYRIAFVGGGVLGWFLLDFVNVGSLTHGSLVGLFLGQLLLILAALVVLMAYYPPRFVRERFGVEGISEPSTDAGR